VSPDQSVSDPSLWIRLWTSLLAIVASIGSFLLLFPTKGSMNEKFKACRAEEERYREGVDIQMKAFRQELVGVAERSETAVRKVTEAAERIETKMEEGFRHTHERIDARLNGG